MIGSTAPVTNALEFAGPPAAAASYEAGFQVVVHDTARVALFAIGAAAT
jgi:hypothetical protein